MKLKTCLWLSFSLSFVALVSAAKDVTAEEEEVQPYAIPGHYIVALKRGYSPGDVARAHGLAPHTHFSQALNGFAGAVPPGRLHALRHDPRVDFIDPDLQLFISAQTLPSGVKRIGTLLSSAAKINGLDERVNVDIAVLDTGIAPHSDLNLFRSVSFIPGQTNDLNGHGTHVAGIAAALDNDVGVVGVAPGARLWDVKVIDDNGFSTTSRLIQGIDYVTQNAGQIEVANLSLTGIGYSSSLRQAIVNSVAAGVVYVVSAGNDGRDIYGTDGVFNTGDDSIPAAYPEVMTVSALSDFDGIASGDDALANFSNYSASVAAGNPVSAPGAAIDLAAPGVNIYSTYPGNGYATMSGTSMSTPHAAGAAALYVATNGRATNAAGAAAIRQALINSAQPQTAWGSANTQDPDSNREGLVHAGAIAPTNNPPTVNITAPATGASFAFGTTIQFTGTATDTEDGNRTANLVWTSSIDGQIGTGGSFSRVLTAGTHTITATVADTGGKTGTRSISVTVLTQPPASALSVAVVTDKSSYVNRNRVYITVTATSGGNRVAGVATHLELETADGNIILRDATTDAYGVARIQHTVSSKRDGIGIYLATVTCAKSGYIAGSGTTTFEVRK